MAKVSCSICECKHEPDEECLPEQLRKLREEASKLRDEVARQDRILANVRAKRARQMQRYRAKLRAEREDF